MGRRPPNSKQCFPCCCSRHGLLSSPLGVSFHQSKLLRAFRTSKNGVSCTSNRISASRRSVLEKKMVEAIIPLWHKTPSTHDTRQLWRLPTAVRAMMRNASIKTKSFRYSLKKLQQRLESPYPVMKVACQIAQSYSIEFPFFVLGSDFVLFGFTIEILRSVDSCGLVVDSGPHPKIIILRQDDSKTFYLAVDSAVPSPHRILHRYSPICGLTPFRLLWN